MASVCECLTKSICRLRNTPSRFESRASVPFLFINSFRSPIQSYSILHKIVVLLQPNPLSETCLRNCEQLTSHGLPIREVNIQVSIVKLSDIIIHFEYVKLIQSGSHQLLQIIII